MLIQNGLVLLRVNGVYRFGPQDLRVEDGRITAIGPHLAPIPGEECVPAEGLLILPGLVNAHVHSYTNLLKGTSFGEPLELWGLGTVALGGAMSGEEMALSARLGIAEMLRRGVTACIDHIPHPGAVYPIASEYRNAGFRAALAPMLHDRSDHLVLSGVAEELPSGVRNKLAAAANPSPAERIAQYRRWIRDLHRPDETVSMLVGVNAPQRCTEALLSEAGNLANEHGLGVHMHLLETTWQADSGLAEGVDPVEKILRNGLLNGQTSLAHCVHLSRGQIEQIACAGATVVHNPTSNLFLGSGIMPLGLLREHGIPVAFGSDGTNCATSHNLLEIARTAMLLERGVVSDPARWRPLGDWYDGLTRTGWRAMRRGGPGGELEVGAAADLIFCGADVPALLPAIDLPMQFLVNQAQPDVRHVMIAGEFVLRNQVILAFDEAELYATLRERSPRLRETFQTALEAAAVLRPAYEKAFGRRLERAAR